MADIAPLAELEARVKARPLPRHVAVIMDGNGRWAEQRGLPRVEGHREGAEAVRAVTRTARRVGLQALTLYAFSAENWGRPDAEVTALMELLADFLESEREEMRRNSIRLNAIGELERLPRRVQDKLAEVRAETVRNDAMTLTLALSYGGRQELVAAARAAAAARGAALTAEDLERHLWTQGSPSSTCWSARAASGASPTSSCGSARTPSCTSPTRSGRTSGIASCCSPSRTTRGGSGASA